MKPSRKDRKGSDREGRTSLHYAAAEGNVELCNELIEGGSNPNSQDDSGLAPLHFAAQSSSHETVSVLLAAGAAANLTDTFGNTPLLKAVFASRGCGETINALRQAGADPSIANNSGVTAVSLARMIGNYDVAQFFRDLP